jgi:hypothetical protein
MANWGQPDKSTGAATWFIDSVACRENCGVPFIDNLKVSPITSVGG